MHKTTVEKQASQKNGMSRMIVTVLSILLQVMLVLGLFTKLNEIAVWLNFITTVLAVILVLKIYGQHKTASMKMPWIILTVISPVTGVVLYALIGGDGYTRRMRKRYEEIDRILLSRLPQNQLELECMASADPDAGSVSTYYKKECEISGVHAFEGDLF